MKIILVDDEAQLRKMIRGILEAHGHICLEASNGLEATKIIEEDPSLELLISDFRMPLMGGAELLQWCRRNGHHFPILFITANAYQFEEEKLALRDCCAGLLPKPFEIQELLDAVTAAAVRDHSLHCPFHPTTSEFKDQANAVS